MVKFVSVMCDNCGYYFIREKYWTKEFIMDTGRDECPDCTILHGGNPFERKTS